MRSDNRASIPQISQLLALGLLLAWPVEGWGQALVASVPTGIGADTAVAFNPVTNKIYVAGRGRPSGPFTWHPGDVALVDAETSSSTLIDPNAVNPRAVAVNSVTNKIYVADYGDIFPFGCCTDPGKVTVLDGATNTATEIVDPNAAGPINLAVNPVTNMIYVANWLSGNVTVIDGSTNAITTLTDPNASSPFSVAVNSVTNKIYVANQGSLVAAGTSPGNVTVIDGATNAITTVVDPNAFVPNSVAVNPVTNKIYVANQGSFLHNGTNTGNVTVIDGVTNATTTITDPNAITPGGGDCRGFGVAVNSATNKIYVVNEYSHNITAIDGATNATTTVTDPNAIAPVAVAVDSVTNKIYVANAGNDAGSGQDVTIIDGATNSTRTLIDLNAKSPDAVVVDPASNKIYVANSLADTLTVIDGGAVPTSFIIFVQLAGNGSGTVTSSPGGINCPGSCSASFNPGTTVSLSASQASGSEFSGWSGPCTGTSACILAISSDDFVTTTFNVLLPDFSLSPASAILTVQRGAQGTDVLTVAPMNGSFSNAVQLSCAVAGPTPMPTCALSPTSVTPGANSTTSTLTITAPGLAAQLTPPGQGWRLGPLYAVALPFAGLALIGFGAAEGKSKQRRRQLWLLCGLSIALIALQAGCGGGSSSQQLQPQTYTVTVTATSGAIQHSTQVTVTVQ